MNIPFIKYSMALLVVSGLVSVICVVFLAVGPKAGN